MENKPEYRIKFEVYDASNDCEVSTFDAPLQQNEIEYGQDQGNLQHLLVALRRFNDGKAEHESTYYPTESESDD